MTRKTRILTTWIIGASLTLTSVAFAKGDGEKKGPRGDRMGKLFERFDANKDGKLTKSEVPEKLWNRLSRADANKDGAVTKAELEAKRAEWKSKKGDRKKGDKKRGDKKKGDKREKKSAS
ncbi:MAG: hypothetical protein KF915_16915 [Polyangiaceae bacterium]|nr:hypothetical protein [Polyangiaceae bacterium]